jgi:hypothetical protein
MVVLGLITLTFGLIIFLFALSFIPNEAISGFAVAALHAGSSILGAIDDIIDIAITRAREGFNTPTTTTVP